MLIHLLAFCSFLLSGRKVFVVHAGLPGPDPRLPFNDAGGKGTGYDAMADSGRRGGGQNLSLLGHLGSNCQVSVRFPQRVLVIFFAASVFTSKYIKMRQFRFL